MLALACMHGVQTTPRYTLLFKHHSRSELQYFLSYMIKPSSGSGLMDNVLYVVPELWVTSYITHTDGDPANNLMRHESNCPVLGFGSNKIVWMS
mgnify:CR=1 FL=1